MASALQEALLASLRGGLGANAVLCDGVVPLSKGHRRGALTDAVQKAVVIWGLETGQEDDLDVGDMVEALLAARRRAQTAARVSTLRMRAKRSREEVQDESQASSDQPVRAESQAVDTKDQATPGVVSKGGDVEVSEWCFERRVASLCVEGKEYTHSRLFQNSPSKGPGSAVGAVFEVRGQEIVTRVRSIWWEVVTNMTGAKHRNVIRHLKRQNGTARLM